MSGEDLLATVVIRSNEAGDLDFKSSFDPNVLRDWLELIKDIAAFANSGGGHILVGLNDDGLPSGADVSPLLSVDPADFGNRIHKYTGQHFDGIDVLKCEKSGCAVCAIRVSPIQVPIVFERVGEFELPDSRKKTVFALGTVYFRHGAKSEPGTSDDLRDFLNRELERIRRSWLDGITKVVEAPVGSNFVVVSPDQGPIAPPRSVAVQLTSDPKAPAYFAIPLDETHPFRQKEVVREVNARLSGKKTITSHHLVCIRRAYSVEEDIKFCYTQKYASPRYSQKFIDWIVAQYEKDNSFFENAKARYDETRASQTQPPRRRIAAPEE